MAEVSVIVITYNDKPLLELALDSVLQQSFTDFELIVVEDGCTDGTADFVRSISDARVRLISSPHLGNLGELRNLGFQASTGELIALLDSDDVWRPDKLATQFAALRDSPEYGWCYGRTLPIDESRQPVASPDAHQWAPISGWILNPLLTLEAKVPISSVMIRRAAYQAVGGFTVDPHATDDYDMWFRLGAQFQALAVPDYLCSTLCRSGAYSADRVKASRAWQHSYRQPGSWVREPGAKDHCRRAVHRFRLLEAWHRARLGERRLPLALLARSVPDLLRFKGWRTAGAACGAMLGRGKAVAYFFALSTCFFITADMPFFA